MEAHRQGDNIVVTLTPQEAHVIIWGGFQSAVDRVHHNLRHHLVNVEDAAFSNDEYEALFGDLEGMYADLAAVPAVNAERE